MGYTRKLIDLSLLNINIENPRFEMVGNQREAIKKMMTNSIYLKATEEQLL
jgi:hypothetical protein